MRRVALLLSLALVVHCHRATKPTAVQQPPFDANAFIVSTMQLAQSDIAIAPLTASKGVYSHPQTRRLATDVAREQRMMLAALTPIAQRRRIAPAPLPDAQVALRESLVGVDDQFDQAYALAMVQNLDAQDAELARAAASSDPELRQFAARFEPMVRARRADAAEVLNAFGGSPFHVAK